MNQHAIRWVKRLPLRWALGALVASAVAGLVLVVLVALTPKGLHGSPVKMAAGMMMLMLPMVLLCFAWGWSERRNLQRWAAHGLLEQGLSDYVLRQAVKALIVCLLFTLYLILIDLIPAQDLAANPAGIADSMLQVAFGVVVVGTSLGLIVGAVTRKNLRRRLARDRLA
jgi:hypothetical protein